MNYTLQEAGAKLNRSQQTLRLWARKYPGFAIKETGRVGRGGFNWRVPRKNVERILKGEKVCQVAGDARE